MRYIAIAIAIATTACGEAEEARPRYVGYVQTPCSNGRVLINAACVCPPGTLEQADGSCAGCAADRVLAGEACVCPADTIELDDGTCATTNGCPPHSYRVDTSTCRCVPGYYVNLDGNACVPPDELCPANSHFVEEGDEVGCACDAGYQANATGDGCMPIDECPPNSHDVDGGCMCDPGYVVDGNACVPETPECPPHSHYDTDGCYCDEGYVVNVERTACVLPEEACPEPHPRVIVNGQLLACCPIGSSAAIVNNTATCVCPDNGAYDPVSNTCAPGDPCPPNSHQVATSTGWSPDECECDPGYAQTIDGCVPDGSDGDLVLVEQGETTDGSNIPMGYDYYIGRTEVTRVQYMACVDAGACVDHSSDGSCLAQRVGPGQFTYGNLSLSFTADSQPAVCVSWYDAIAYLNWRSVEEGFAVAYSSECLTDASACTLLDEAGEPTNDPSRTVGYRLPHLRWEWWYAARGGNVGAATSYAGSNDPDRVAWYQSNAHGRTYAVGSKNANELGLHDMSGNALEWLFDLSPVGTSMRRAFGGGWDSDAEAVEIVHGGKNMPPDWSESDIGFRVVRTQ